MFSAPQYEQQLYHSRVSNATVRYSSVSLAFCVVFCDNVEMLLFRAIDTEERLRERERVAVVLCLTGKLKTRNFYDFDNF